MLLLHNKHSFAIGLDLRLGGKSSLRPSRFPEKARILYIG